MQNIPTHGDGKEPHMDHRQGHNRHRHDHDRSARLLPPLENWVHPVITVIVGTTSCPVDDVECQVDEGDGEAAPKLEQVPGPVRDELVDDGKDSLNCAK